MSNGLGFVTHALLAVLVELALFALMATIVSTVYHRRTGQIPSKVCDSIVLIGVGALGVAGLSVLVLSQKAPAGAQLLLLIGVAPLTVVSVYLDRTTELTHLDALVTTVMAWGLPFLIGMGVTFKMMDVMAAVLGVVSGSPQRMGVPWIAATIGGVVIVLGMFAIGNHLSTMGAGATGSGKSG